MPDNLKRKLPVTRKGPSPKWDMPLRWEQVARENLSSTSIEISIWCQERFRKTMLGYVGLNVSHKTPANHAVTWFDVDRAEIAAWQSFVQSPTGLHHCRLPLRRTAAD